MATVFPLHTDRQIPNSMLLIWKDETEREAIAAALRRAGWIVTETGDADDGLDLLTPQNHEAALIDEALPVQNGKKVESVDGVYIAQTICALWDTSQTPQRVRLVVACKKQPSDFEMRVGRLTGWIPKQGALPRRIVESFQSAVASSPSG